MQRFETSFIVPAEVFINFFKVCLAQKKKEKKRSAVKYKNYHQKGYTHEELVDEYEKKVQV